jgi:hypothetical protein
MTLAPPRQRELRQRAAVGVDATTSDTLRPSRIPHLRRAHARRRPITLANRRADVRHPHHYDPNQPRVPKGHSTGGQWADGNHGQATILEEGDRAGGRYGQDTILQSPPQEEDSDAQDARVRLAFLRGSFRGPVARALSDTARQKALERARKEAAEAARERAIKYGLVLFSTLSALNSRDRRVVVEFEAHEYGRDKENTLEFKKLGVLTEAEFRKRCNYLTEVQKFADAGAREANTKPGLNPRTYGTYVHEYVKDKINGMHEARFWAERSAFKSSAALPDEVRERIQEQGEAPRGYVDTVRTDGYEYLGEATGCLYELKTGEAQFGPSRMREFADAIFATDDIYRDPERVTHIKQNFAKRGLPVLRLIMTVVRPRVPRVLNPAQ